MPEVEISRDELETMIQRAVRSAINDVAVEVGTPLVQQLAGAIVELRDTIHANQRGVH